MRGRRTRRHERGAARPRPGRVLAGVVAAAVVAVAAAGTLVVGAAAGAGAGDDHRSCPASGGEVRDRRVAIGREVRAYRLAIPRRPAGSPPGPMLVAFHGYGSSPARLAARSGILDLAARRGVAVALPLGAGAVPRWTVPAGLRGGDDLAFARHLLDVLPGEACADPSRVHLAGFSNGAAFAAHLSCQAPGRVAGAVLVAGANLTAVCPSAPPLPVVAFHGAADAVVPDTGGAVLGGRLLAAPLERTMAGWAARNGCRAAGAARRAGPVAARTWSGCRGGAGVTSYVLDGWPHEWPTRAAAGVDAGAAAVSMAAGRGGAGAPLRAR